MDYILNVYAGGEFVCVLGGNNMNYDNIVWWQLSCLINEYKGKKVSKDDLKKTINSVCAYFYVLDEEEVDDEPSIDLVNETIEKPIPTIYRFDEINADECGFELIRENGEYYSQYYEDRYLIPHVEFDENLLTKKICSFDEFFVIKEFVDSALKDSGRDFILNKDKILVLYSI